ncbi:MAG: TusE/DsrC/DsvC family sulfur relay protein [Xanthomonadales bacterium]|nr:TusE/DsrC/DsvC family sulfur relay protein [Xanthomonadales bacterium]
MSEKDASKSTIVVDGLSYDLDEAGYLLDVDSWTRAFAEAKARSESLQLLPDHWQLIEYAREFYQRYDESPPMRPLVKWLQQQKAEETGHSRYLYRLFPDGPGKQLSLLAGLPKPVSCI